MRGRRTLTAVVVAAVLLAGCGSDGDDTATTDETATTDDATADDTAAEAPADETDEPVEPTEPAGDDEPPAGYVNACALLEQLDIEGLLGEPAGEPEGESDVLGNVCVVEPAAEESQAALRLVVSASRGADNYATQKETFGVDTEVTGLGDEAFHSGPYLFALQGDTMAFLQVLRDINQGSPAVDDAEIEAAMAIVLDYLDG